MSIIVTTKSFIEKAKIKHGNRYDYNKCEYVNAKTKIEIICKKHGSFWQTPNNHLSKSGCKKCADEKLKNERRFDFNYFVKMSNLKHNFKYTYESENYENLQSTVMIKCSIHGSFHKKGYNHLNRGDGCPKCKSKINRRKIKNNEDFIKQLSNKNKGIYEYDIEYFGNNYPKLRIKCLTHNEWFVQSVWSHIKGRGCNRCASKIRNKSRELDRNEILKNLTDDRYEYIDFKERNLKIYCKIHNSIFDQNYYVHKKGGQCPKCSFVGISKPEIEIQNFIKELGYNILVNRRNIINPYELDIFIPELNKAIEFNGEYWHYDKSNKHCKPKGYHGLKSNLCREKNIKLLHVREKLWLQDKDRILKIIKKFLEI